MDRLSHPRQSFTVRVLTFLLAILLTLALILTLLAISFERTLFSESFFNNILIEQHVENQIPGLLTETLLKAANSGDATSKLFGLLTQEQISNFSNEIVPPTYVQDQTNQLLDSLFNFINLKSSTLVLKLDLTPIKNNLQGQAGLTAVNQLLYSMPTCTQEQILAFVQISLQQKSLTISNLPKCKPPEPYISLLMPVFSTTLHQLSAAIPSEVSIVNEQGQGFNSQLENSQVFQVYVLIRESMNLLPWLALFLVALLIILNFRAGKALFSSLGIPLLIAGGLCLFLYWQVKMYGQGFLMSYFQTGSNPVLNSLVTSITLAAVNQFVVVGLIVCGIAFGVGILFALIALIIKA